RELMELRAIVERYAAEQLVSAGRPPVAELRSLLEQQRELTGAEDAKEFIDVDHRFHSALISAVGNSLLDRHYDGLRSRQVRAG
ncbi:FCD domain-containing protein, partial [Xylella fastidiosa subsp. multiplex]|nr:FCD domain-containing protein [Xylella fastidiosa subsp. multiplex]